jgi:hypothetical protein
MIDFLDVHDYARLSYGPCPHLPHTARALFRGMIEPCR